MRRRDATLAAVALVALLSGCTATATPAPTLTHGFPNPYLTATPGPGGPGTAPDDGGVYPLNPATHPHVQLWCPLVGAVHDAVPADDVESVTVCTTAPWTDAPDGTPQIVEYVYRVAQEDVPGLLAAYSVPDASTPPGTACDASFPDPLVVWLHHGASITPVYAPMDECRHPQEAAAEAYAGLELHEILVAREKLRQ